MCECACCLIRTWCDPDEDVQGGPAANGYFVIPSPMLLSSWEEGEEEAAGGVVAGGGEK